MNILIVLASQNFRDEEYSISKKVLEQKNILVLTFSTTTDTITGMLGLVTKPDINIVTGDSTSASNLFAQTYAKILLKL